MGYAEILEPIRDRHVCAIIDDFWRCVSEENTAKRAEINHPHPLGNVSTLVVDVPAPSKHHARTQTADSEIHHQHMFEMSQNKSPEHRRSVRSIQNSEAVSNTSIESLTVSNSSNGTDQDNLQNTLHHVPIIPNDDKKQLSPIDEMTKWKSRKVERTVFASFSTIVTVRTQHEFDSKLVTK